MFFYMVVIEVFSSHIGEVGREISTVNSSLFFFFAPSFIAQLCIHRNEETKTKTS